MKLIIGLGNPGEKYKNNRHNVGHMVVDALGRMPGVAARKTSVFMNNSGEEIKKFTSAYSLLPNALYIIHDDLDIPLGQYKIQKGKGPKLHKGLESIERALGTSDFWRIRVGVDNRKPEDRTPGEQYVLQDFMPQEKEIIGRVIDKIVSYACLAFTDTP